MKLHESASVSKSAAPIASSPKGFLVPVAKTNRNIIN